MNARHETAQDAEDAFYRAFETADLGAMRRVWAEADDIVCVHPGSPLLHGWSDIGPSWEQIFNAPARMSFRVHHHQWIKHGDVAVHLAEEEITAAGDDDSPLPRIPVTNIYRRSAQGWQLVVHHASLPPPTATSSPRDERAPPRRALH